MQSPESNPRAAGPVKHPDATEWMTYLYHEVTPARKQELQSHLAECTECREQLACWSRAISTLDRWHVKSAKPERWSWQPVFKWAAAAAVLLTAGFALGRQMSSNAKEISGLKASLTQLSVAMQNERTASSNHIHATIAAANVETLRLLAEYSQLQQSQRMEDQQALALTFRSVEQRIAGLRSELETVALNTETGFETTHENITRLASLSLPTANMNESANHPQ
jgi:hypothetical protein